MDYIKEVLTEDELLDQIYQRSKSKDVITVMKAALSNFDWFCQDQYSLNRNQVMNDLIKEYQENRDTRKPLMLMNSFKKWLSENHDDIELKLGKSAKRRKKAVLSFCLEKLLQASQTRFSSNSNPGRVLGIKHFLQYFIVQNLVTFIHI